jgi:poly(A) polymerase
MVLDIAIPSADLSKEKVTPLIIPRSEHPISRKMIDEEALKVLYRLHRHGFSAYLVGGSVRDLLLGKVPKDFDVATNAHPQEINNLFRNSRIIGRRFRLVQVFFKGGKIIEVSTFRSRSEFEEIETEEGNVIRTDSFGTPEDDAQRRDITINGLFYNIADFSIIDHVGGMADLGGRMIRTIGDPNERFQQDPVRMIRVIRHAARTGFSIEDATRQAIIEHRDEIRKCSPSRVRDEFIRDLREGVAQPSLHLMLQTDLLFSFFPDFLKVFGDWNPLKNKHQQFFLRLFGLVDRLVKVGRSVPESILFALFLTPYLRAVTPEHPFLGDRERSTYLAQTIRLFIQEILTPFSVPRGTKEMASQILVAQSNLKKSIHRGVIPRRLRLKKYFLEAVLFFGIEAQAKNEKLPRLLRNAVPADLLPWWPKEFKRRRHAPRRGSWQP